MAETILFVFEGEKTEPQILKNLEKRFFNTGSTPLIYATYNAEIYQLWKRLEEDEDTLLDVDLIEVLKDRCTRNFEKLKNLEREDIGQIYLFFDYDGHATGATDEDIEHMLSYFNDEFDRGKLYISYPMVEAVKDAVPEFQYHTVPAKEKSDYKKMVSERTIYQDINFIDHAGWLHIISENLKKSNFIVNRDYSELESHPQQDSIFDGQQEYYIKPNGTIAVLSGIPFFIVEYFDSEKLSEILHPSSVNH